MNPFRAVLMDLGIVKKEDDKRPDFIVFGVLPALLLGTAFVSTEISNARENRAQIERTEPKERYLTSDRFTDFEVIDAAWEERIDDTYDVFLLDTESSGIVQVSVFDTEVNNRFRVEPHTESLDKQEEESK